MSTLIRTAKSGSEWTANDLAAFNISIERNDDKQFFGYKIDTVNIDDYPPGILAAEPNRNNPAAYKLLKYMDLAMSVHEKEESAVDDFAVNLFECIGYTDLDHFACTRKDIRLFMCGHNVYAKTDVCIMDESEILFLLQENKSHVSSSDPEPQLIAEAIAAFQHNNSVRDRVLSLPTLDEYTFPCITMLRTYPTFYKIKVTNHLDKSVRFGTYPQYQTIINSFSPLRGARRHSEGMRDPKNREQILKAFKAFRPLMNF